MKKIVKFFPLLSQLIYSRVTVLYYLVTLLKLRSQLLVRRLKIFHQGFLIGKLTLDRAKRKQMLEKVKWVHGSYPPSSNY